MMNPAFTTSGNTRTATAFDLAFAAAGFWATSCSRARRESLVKSPAEAVCVLSNATVASIKPGAYFHFDVIFIYCLFNEVLTNFTVKLNSPNHGAPWTRCL